MARPDATAWKVATEYYPDLVDLDRYLHALSEEIASDFRMTILRDRAFTERHELARQIEADFLAKNFGRNEQVVAFGRELILLGYKQPCSELRQIVAALGDDFDPDVIIAGIRQKYPDIHVVGLYSFYSVTGALTTPVSRSPEPIAERLLRTKFVEDAEELIVTLGGKVFQKEVSSRWSSHVLTVVILGERHETFNTLSEMTQWVMNEIAIPALAKP
jgi:hypothetical protein